MLLVERLGKSDGWKVKPRSIDTVPGFRRLDVRLQD